MGRRVIVLDCVASTNDAAWQEALDNETIDAYVAYLNEGLCIARALDSASQPAASASA